LGVLFGFFFGRGGGGFFLGFFGGRGECVFLEEFLVVGKKKNRARWSPPMKRGSEGSSLPSTYVKKKKRANSRREVSAETVRVS